MSLLAGGNQSTPPNSLRNPVAIMLLRVTQLAFSFAASSLTGQRDGRSFTLKRLPAFTIYSPVVTANRACIPNAFCSLFGQWIDCFLAGQVSSPGGAWSAFSP